MNIVVIDYETYYDSDYSLTKMPTAQYIRDPRFKALGLAVAAGARAGSLIQFEPAQWHTDARAASLVLDQDAVWVAHNAQFDGAIAWYHYGVRPKFWLDTQLMARYCVSQGILPADASVSLAALAEHFGLEAKGDTAAAVAAGGEVLAEYATHDIDLSIEVLRRLLPHVPPFELRLMDLHVRMATEPVLDLCDEELQGEIESATLDPKLRKAVGSNNTFAELLRRLDIEPGTKISPTTGKETYAFAKTDEFMRELQLDPRPVVRALAEARLASKSNLRHTRAARFQALGAPMPVPLLYYGAHTGRSSGLDRLNLQNLPSRVGRLRHALQAPPGHTLVVGDSSQVEVRVLAWRARDEALLQIIRDKDAGIGPDVYAAFAADNLYGKPWQEVTKQERDMGKPPVLACGFGMSEAGLVAYAANMGLAMDERMARQAVQGYRRRFPGVVAWWDESMQEIRESGRQALPSGRLLTYPDLRHEGRDLVFERHRIFSRGRVGHRQKVRLWHGLAVENDTQAVARDVVMWQALQLERQYKIVLLVHDEIVLCVPEAQAEQAQSDLLQALCTAPPWAQGLPLQGEVFIVCRYGDAG